MSFKNLNIKPCYESGVDDIIEDYYIPVLRHSVSYDRIAGFFASSSMAVVARGLSDFIQNGGNMRLITSPRLTKEDSEVVKKIANDSKDLTLKDFGIDTDNLECEFEKNHVKALGWMLANGLLEMKLAIVVNEDGSLCDNETISENGLFHQKVGILRDSEGNELSFSGSINETAAAWVNNNEEFKVFKNWTESKGYYLKDKQSFDDIWHGRRNNVRVYNLPTAIKHDIIRYSSDFNAESISLRRYRAFKLKNFNFKQDSTLFFYQQDALEKWKENGYRLLFEMATGTGKTRTAIAGIKYLNQKVKKLITIISTPQNTLSKQWKNEIDALNITFDESIVIDGSVSDWSDILTKLLYKNGAGLADHCVFYTTHATASSVKFTNVMVDCLQPGTEVLFVGDETHWLGARKLQNALLPIYKYRIGLSATPSRWFDDSGTAKLIDYYGNNSFEFSIKDALTEYNPITGKHFLVNYNYLILKVRLNEDETKDYKNVSERISKLWSIKDNNSDAASRLERLLEKRANIVKNAESKYEAFESILDDLKFNGRISNLLIFVSPQQITRVIDILNNKGIISHKLTEKEGTRPEKRFNNKSEREEIISKFKDGVYQAIVAIKCMDEGIDIPTADTGILMASSTNPREYIQRIGRIIRQAPNKKFANLYDICVDTIADLNDSMIPLEQKIKAKEQVRLKEIAENAINAIDALRIINSLD